MADRRDVLSELYLFQKDKWLIKYRITYPSDIKDHAKKLIEKLISDHIISNLGMEPTEAVSASATRSDHRELSKE